MAVGCIDNSALSAPNDDPELVAGQQVYTSQCASCHGAQGGGGRGNQLTEGMVLNAFPDPAAEVAQIVNGKGQMPAFGKRLTEEQIANVVRYTREVLNDAPARE